MNLKYYYHFALWNEVVSYLKIILIFIWSSYQLFSFISDSGKWELQMTIDNTTKEVIKQWEIIITHGNKLLANCNNHYDSQDY